MTTHLTSKVFLDWTNDRCHTKVLIEFWCPKSDDKPEMSILYDQNHKAHRVAIGVRVGTWLARGPGYAVCSETQEICGKGIE